MADPIIGVISDTHGYLNPDVCGLFAGVDLIIHAGDIVDPAILTELEAVAPVVAVAGNVEAGGLAERLPKEVAGQVAGVRYVVGHKRKRLLKRLAAGRIGVGADGSGPDLVVYGHEHVPSSVWVDGTLYLNPGTATSPDEEDDDPTVAVVVAGPTGLSVRFIPLERKHVAESVARPAQGRPNEEGQEER